MNRKIKLILTKIILNNLKSRPTHSVIAFASLCFTTFGTQASEANHSNHHYKVTFNQALEWADKAQEDTAFPIIVNGLVLEQLNRILSSSRHRSHFGRILYKKNELHEKLVPVIAQHGVPPELLVVPIIESEYKNTGVRAPVSSRKPAGLWQLIPKTARNLGLKITSKKDERLDLVKSTDAAIRYLHANQIRFQDWHLSLLAYNMGENKLQSLINKFDTSDPWKIISKGPKKNSNYLPRLMASVILMKNPEVLN